MAKSKVDLTKGDFEVKINNETILLNSRFANQYFLEQYMDMGLYKLSDRVMAGDVRIGDIASILYCFSDDRDSKGKSFNDFGEKVTKADFNELLLTLQKFFQVVHRIEEMEELTLEMNKQSNQKKKSKKSSTKKKTA